MERNCRRGAFTEARNRKHKEPWKKTSSWNRQQFPPNPEPTLRAKMRERLLAPRPTYRNAQHSQQVRKRSLRNMIVFIIMRPERNSKCMKLS